MIKAVGFIERVVKSDFFFGKYLFLHYVPKDKKKHSLFFLIRRHINIQVYTVGEEVVFLTSLLYYLAKNMALGKYGIIFNLEFCNS